MTPPAVSLLFPGCLFLLNSYDPTPFTQIFIPFFNCLKKSTRALPSNISTQPPPSHIKTESLALQLLKESAKLSPLEEKEGGEGKVKFLKNTEETPIALKVLKDFQVDRFAREVRFTKIANKCRHGVHYQTARINLKGQFELITDLAGQDLFEVLSTSPGNQGLSLEKTLEIAKQVLEFLKGFHEEEAIHGDLRLENIVWDFTVEAARVIDLGMSRRFQETQLNWAPPYIGPELVFQMKTAPHQDFWNLGLIIYTLLTHKELFPKKMTPLQFEKVLQREFGKLPQSMIKKMDPDIRAQVFKLENGNYISRNGKIPYSPSWEQTIRRKIKDYSEANVEGFMNFLKSLFNYRNPKTAKQLLKHPFMNIDTSFQIEIDESLLSNGLDLVIRGSYGHTRTLPVSKALNGSCIHVAPSETYEIQVYKNTKLLFRKLCSIVQDSKVGIRA